jgi:hypothetical protein
MKFRDPFFRRSNFIEDVQDIAFAFNGPADDLTGKTSVTPLIRKRIRDNGKLPAAFSVQCRIDDNEYTIFGHN